MLIFLVADVGDPGEAGREGVADLLFADEALTPWIGSSRRFEGGVIGELAEDPVEVVSIECCSDLPEHLYRAIVLH